MDYTRPNVKLYNVPWTTDGFNGMPYRTLGKSGLRVSNVGLGTWKIGYPETGDGSRVDEKTAFKIFDRAVELGVTFWDTANRYNNASGNSERIIGNWLQSNPDQRRNIIIATKLFGGMDGITPNHSRLSRINIIESVYASLKRLKCDYIDLLYFHAFDDSTPIEESLSAIDDLIRRDLVRYFAVSNFTVHQLELYRQCAGSISPRCCVLAVQNQFDILNGEDKTRKGVLEYAASAGLSFVAWSPLARGLLTGRYLDVNKVGAGDRLFDEGDANVYLDEKLRKKVTALSALAKKWDMELSQLTLAYMLSMPGMGPVIPSSSSVKQLELNAAAGKIVLDEKQKDEIKNITGI